MQERLIGLASVTSHYPRLDRIIRILGIFFVGQLTAQALNALTGIALVRWLPKNEYAWLTITNVVTATFSVLFDPAIGVGLQSLAAPARENPEKLSCIFASALRWRWYWLALTSLVMMPLSFFLLLKSGASWSQSSLLLLATWLGVPAMTSAMIFGTVPKIKTQLRVLQLADIIASAVRLLLSVAALFAAKLAIFATLASSSAQWVQAKWLQHSASVALQPSESPSSEMATALTTQMKQMLPHSLFLCLQGHIGIWLLGCFGSVESLADLGALTRLGILLASVGVFAQQVLIPAMSRADSRERLFQLAGGSLLAGLACTVSLVVVSWYFPCPFLWLLGPQYAHLKSELALAMGFFSLSALSTIIWWFNAAQGWVAWAMWVPPLSIAAYGIACLSLKPSTTWTALLVLLSGQAASLLLGVVQSWRGLRQMPLVPPL